MHKYIQDALCDADLCTGCMACVNTCRHKAIFIGSNSEGFYRPLVDIEKCIDCGACNNICPQKSPPKITQYEQQAFRCWHKNKAIRRASSSGGIFSAVGDKIIISGGIVYGVKFDESTIAVFSSSDIDGNTTDPYKGSKYVQAKIGEETFRSIKRHLIKGKRILFSGTPCQVAGLKKYLGRDYDNLYTIDFLCHGVPSPLIFNMYKSSVEEKGGSKIKSFSFRDKWRSWRMFNFKITLEKGLVIRQFRHVNSFCQIFLRDFALSPSCYNCQYVKHERNSDLTIADYWQNIGNSNLLGDGDRGVSLCVVNSEKGVALLQLCKNDIVCKKISAERVLTSYKYFNISTNCPSARASFWKDVRKNDYELLARKYGYPAKSSIADKLLMNYGFPRCTSLLSRIINKLELKVKH